MDTFFNTSTTGNHQVFFYVNFAKTETGMGNGKDLRDFRATIYNYPKIVRS